MKVTFFVDILTEDKRILLFLIGDNEKEKCLSGNHTHQSWNEYVKTNESVKFTMCAVEDDGKICRISLEKENVDIKYCFKDKDNKTQ